MITESEMFDLKEIADVLGARLEIHGKGYNQRGGESDVSLVSRAIVLLAKAYEAQWSGEETE